MEKVYFFFTRLNNCDFSNELVSRDFFTESIKEVVDGKEEIEKIGFNYSSDARIAQLYFANEGVEYRYIQSYTEVLNPFYPLVFLICDNTYKMGIDELLDSLFRSFKERKVYCYFHQSNSTIKEIVLETFSDKIYWYDAFHHEKEEPFFELISLIDVDSQESFIKKTKEIQYKYLDTDEEIQKKKDLSKKLILLHKILGQGYRLGKGDQNEIRNFLGEDFTFDQNLEGLTQLRNYLLKY